MIPEGHRDAIITAAAHFVQEITSAYGGDTGIVLWEQISEVIDPEIRGQLFMVMLSGESLGNSKINIPVQDPVRMKTLSHSRVEFIRFVRQHDSRKLGLKEAKDISDDIIGSRPTFIMVSFADRSRIISDLRDQYLLSVL